MVFTHFVLANEMLWDVTTNLENFVKFESWRYCEKYDIVEPNKMLPTWGHQKLAPLTNCICTKGSYFVPMVCLNILWHFIRNFRCYSLFLNLFQYVFKNHF